MANNAKQLTAVAQSSPASQSTFTHNHYLLYVTKRTSISLSLCDYLFGWLVSHTHSRGIAARIASGLVETGRLQSLLLSRDGDDGQPNLLGIPWPALDAGADSHGAFDT